MADCVVINDTVIKPIGDVHLGRRFRTGVPLHRLGEREKMIFDQFVDELNEVAGVNIVVQGGDIFDSLTVPLHLILVVAREISHAAARHPGTTYVFVRGNHDASRDANVKSAFDLLAELLRAYDQSNVWVLDDEPGLISLSGHQWLFIPWHPFKPVAEIVATIAAERPDWKPAAAFTHCDVDGNGDNLLPTEALSKITKKVINWHVHKPETFERHGVEVIGTGSMQPFAFGESLDHEHREGPTYTTMTLAQYQAAVDAVGPNCFHDSVIRLRLNPGETVPQDIDALQVVLQRVTESGEEEVAVEFEDFNLDRLHDESMIECEVEPTFREKIKAKLAELKEAENV